MSCIAWSKVRRCLLAVACVSLYSATPLLSQSLLANLEKEVSVLVERAGSSVTTIVAYVPIDKGGKKDGSFFSIFSSKDEHTEKAENHYLTIGTGLYLHEKGYVVTRSSVVANACSVRVRFLNGNESAGELVGVDSTRGIALLKVDPQEITLLPFGRPNMVRPGSWILVIGNSMGVAPAVSMGNVSAVRNDGFIQISANIDPGNNGSPVLNASGEVIGIVSGKINYNDRRTGARYLAGNSALVMPIDEIYDAAEEILKKYSQLHGWLGITVTPIPGDYIRPQITRIEPGSPAAHANLQVGDVILGFNNEYLQNYYALKGLVRKALPGVSHKIAIVRGRDTLDVDIEIGPFMQYKLFEHVPYSRPPLMLDQGNSIAPDKSRTNRYLEQRLRDMERELAKLRSQYSKKSN